MGRVRHCRISRVRGMRAQLTEHEAVADKCADLLVAEQLGLGGRGRGSSCRRGDHGCRGAGCEVPEPVTVTAAGHVETEPSKKVSPRQVGRWQASPWLSASYLPASATHATGCTRTLYDTST